jgi:hypothetical protein
LRDQIAAAIGTRRALAWADSRNNLTCIPFDDEGVVGSSVSIGPGLRIDEGSRVDLAAHTITTSDGNVIRVGENGTLAWTSVQLALDPFIAYFYYATEKPDPSALGAFRFRIFDKPLILEASVTYNPARPLETRITASLDAEPSRFRTRFGNVIALTEVDGAVVFAYDPILKEYYATLDGFWQWSIQGAAPAKVDLLLGFSGLEYVQAPVTWLVRFNAGQPSFAKYFRGEGGSIPTSEFPLVATIDGVEEEITTAWLYVLPSVTAGPVSLAAQGASYFSQPERAGLFAPAEQSEFLGVFDLEAAFLAEDWEASFPSGVYAGLEKPDPAPIAWDSIVRRFESEVLYAARAREIYGNPGPPPVKVCGPAGPTGVTGPEGPFDPAITPQGLLSYFSKGASGQPRDWEQLILAQTNQGRDLLRLTEIDAVLRAALLSNQLFLVVSDPAKLYQYCSTTYAITDQVMNEAKALGVPGSVIDKTISILGIVYESRTYFCRALANVLGSDFDEYRDIFLLLSELAELTIEGWTFDVSSRRWAVNSDRPTILIIKFSDDDVETMTNDLSRWTMPAVFNEGGGEPARQKLLAIYKQARENVDVEPDLQFFVETVLANRQPGARDVWNGVIYLNPAVPTNAFPPELAALAAGLPVTELRGHHLGVTLSSFDVDKGVIRTGDSSLFGLILYSDPTDLIFTGLLYDFKVLSLRVLFANSRISAFSSQVELLVSHLFGELSTLVDSLHGDNILFDGTLQEGTYRFSTTRENEFRVLSQVVDGVTVSSAQFVTLIDESTASRTVARFILAGSMTFRKIDVFDLFGYGPTDENEPDTRNDGQLRFTSLFVSMEFDPNDASATRVFAFQAGQMSFDRSGTRARPGSLPRRFPLTPVSMLQNESVVDERSGRVRTTVPADYGFIPVESPLTPGTLGKEWYGLMLSLSFGSPGALAPKLGFTGALLASWAPSEDAYNVAIGIRLPGSDTGRKSLTIMGPLRLDIGRLIFLYDEDVEGYLLRFQNVALSFLGNKFPPGGQTNALLFGDPDPESTSSSLGWYLAYKKDEKKKKDGQGDSEGGS